MKEITGKPHFWWTKWIIQRKRKPCWKNTSLKASVFWSSKEQSSNCSIN